MLAAKVTANGDRDGLPNVLLEAQSQRLACIATAISGIPELIDTAATGLLVPPGDPAALAGALNALVTDPGRAAEMGRQGRARAVAEFSWVKIAGQTVRLYEELARTA